VQAAPNALQSPSSAAGSSIGSESPRAASWGLDRIDQRDLPLDGTMDLQAANASAGGGSGVIAYVIDTGVRSDHAQFGGRVESGYTAVSDGNGAASFVGAVRSRLTLAPSTGALLSKSDSKTRKVNAVPAGAALKRATASSDDVDADA
jgi:subtilisin family serine protease